MVRPRGPIHSCPALGPAELAVAVGRQAAVNPPWTQEVMRPPPPQPCQRQRWRRRSTSSANSKFPFARARPSGDTSADLIPSRWPCSVQGVVEPCFEHRRWVNPPPLKLGIRQFDDPAFRQQPPAFPFVLDERVDRVAWQSILHRHPLRFALPQSDETVVEGGHNGAVCLDMQVIGVEIGSSTGRKFFLATIAEHHKCVFCARANPNPAARVRRDSPDWNLRRRELFTHPEIAYSYQLPGHTRAHGPDIAIDILCHPEYGPTAHGQVRRCGGIARFLVRTDRHKPRSTHSRLDLRAYTRPDRRVDRDPFEST